MYKSIEALLENTKFDARLNNDGKILSYRISPIEGYKLHEITLDKLVVDEETFEETGEIERGYTTSYVTAGSSYAFQINNREIYAIKE